MAEIYPLFSRDQINKEVVRVAKELADRIRHTYANRRTVMITMLNGGAMFSADLTRALWDIHIRDLPIDYAKVSFYHDNATLREGPVVSLWPDLDVSDKNVIVVDDTMGSGRTFNFMENELVKRGAKQIMSAVVIDARPVSVTKRPTCRCFRVSNEAFLRVGYGEDINGSYRHAPYIGVYSDIQ